MLETYSACWQVTQALRGRETSEDNGDGEDGELHLGVRIYPLYGRVLDQGRVRYLARYEKRSNKNTDEEEKEKSSRSWAIAVLKWMLMRVESLWGREAEEDGLLKIGVVHSTLVPPVNSIYGQLH